TVAGNGVWVADRNFGTTGFLFGIAQRNGSFVIRRHAATRSWERESDGAAVGRTDTGTRSEQTIWLTEPDGAERAVRRVRLTLDHPARDGVLEVLTNLPAEVAVASAVAELYRGRWSVEGLFLRLTTVLRCEVNTLGYPPAALFGFGVALAVGNVPAAVKGALRAAHGAAVAGGVSDYHRALEVSGACPGLWIAVPVETWAGLGAWSVGQMAEWLKGLARCANLGRYRQATRGPKQPKPPRTRFPGPNTSRHRGCAAVNRR
ncbi:transposase, partial [Gemmata sp. JC673]